MKLIFKITSLLLFVSVNAFAQIQQPEVKCDSTYAVIVEEDITYAEGLAHDVASRSIAPMPQKLDLYYPDNNSTNRPVYMFIHGGGFQGGTKTKPEIINMAHYFASRGWVFASVDYRTASDFTGNIYTGIAPQEWIDFAQQNATTPDQVKTSVAMYAAQRDNKAALRWLMANASTYNVNKDFITVGGASAGAITTIALGISNQEDFRDEISLTEDPTLSTTNLNETYEVRSLVDFWGGNVKLDLYESIYGVNRFDSNDPPLFIAHGTEDPTVLFSEAEDMVELYDSTGVHVELYTLEGQGHGAWNAKVDGKSLSELSFDFLVEQQELIVDEDCDQMTSAYEISKAIINIFPNPASHVINIEVEGNLDFEATLYDLNGRIIDTAENNPQIKIASLPVGMYLLEIRDLNSFQKAAYKVMIQK